MASRCVLIDTDPGVDDALAILMAHAHAEVAGLTVVGGNVGLAHTTRNALKLVETIGAETPVFPGSATPLVFSAPHAGFVHGADGFGDTGYFNASRLPEEEHAASAIVRLARERPGELTLVAMAPLTNIALALRLDPSLPQRIARLVVMGGAVDRPRQHRARAGRVQYRLRSRSRACGFFGVAGVRSRRLGSLPSPHVRLRARSTRGSQRATRARVSMRRYRARRARSTARADGPAWCRRMRWRWRSRSIQASSRAPNRVTSRSK